MIYSSIKSTFKLRNYPTVIKDAVEFFKKTNFEQFSDGEYEISGRDVFFQVRDIMTKPIEQCKPEVHRKYIDVQFLHRGKEHIGVVSDTGDNIVDENLLEERDLLFYKDVKYETFINMKEGDFCVFFPSDVHRPGCEREGQSMIRKIVYKIRVDLLDRV